MARNALGTAQDYSADPTPLWEEGQEKLDSAFPKMDSLLDELRSSSASPYMSSAHHNRTRCELHSDVAS